MASDLSEIAPGKAKGPLILVIDIGTSAIKTLLFDQMGRTIEDVECRQRYDIHRSIEGASETDPDELLKKVCKCIDELLPKAGHLTDQIAGVATCTLVGNLLGIDKKKKAITSLMTYADNRSENEAALLRAEFDEATVHNRTGCHFHSSYLPARFRWLARNRPNLFHQVCRWISIGEYLDLKLFGETAVSYSVASWTGLLDRFRLVWDKRLLEKLPVKIDQLSPLVDIHPPKQGLLPTFASRWPILSRLPWFPAVGDGAAANIGSGCTSPSHVAITMGSTTAVRAVTKDAVHHIPKGLWCYRVNRVRFLLGAALSEGGNVFAWMKNTLKLENPSKIERSLAAAAADHHGLTILPFFSGERSPGWHGDAKAAIYGLTLATTPLDILQAGMEAVACRIALVYQNLSELLPPNPKVIASGGALFNSPSWLRILSDVLGKPVTLSRVREVSARGTALLALEALRLVKDVKNVPNLLDETCQPDPARHARYRQTIKRQKKLYKQLAKGGLFSQTTPPMVLRKPPSTYNV